VDIHHKGGYLRSNETMNAMEMNSITRVVTLDVTTFSLFKGLVTFAIVVHSSNEVFIVIEVWTGVDRSRVAGNDDICEREGGTR
jgi:hypothetical protein